MGSEGLQDSADGGSRSSTVACDRCQFMLSIVAFEDGLRLDIYSPTWTGMVMRIHLAPLNVLTTFDLL
jgi:hypothetical protein